MEIDSDDKAQRLAFGEADRKTEEAAVEAVATESEKPVDYRYVRHGQGPCSCCGPHSE